MTKKPAGKPAGKATVSKTSYHHGDLRRALLKAALVILKDQDAKSLSLREVARQAGVSHTAPYRHFVDKAALLEAVAEEGFVEFGRYLTDAVAQANAEPIASLKATGEAYVRYALEHPTHFKVMFSYVPSCPVSSSLPNTAQGTFQILVDVIAAGQAAGLFRAGNPNELAIAQWALVHGLSMLLLDGMLADSQPLYDSAAAKAENFSSPMAVPLKGSAMALVKGAIASSLAGLIQEN
jgi:AcrR family transcriptional regulator